MPASHIPASNLPAPARRRAVPLAVLACAAWLAGCSSDGPVKGVAEIAGLATTAQEAKPFVRETRPVDPAYVPVGRVFAERPLCKAVPGPLSLEPQTERDLLGRTVVVREAPEPCKPRAQFKTIEAELEAKRIANDAASTQAKALGQALPPPKPAVLPPTN